MQNVKICMASAWQTETSKYYGDKGDRPLADWWHDRADLYADRLGGFRPEWGAPVGQL
jgi:hypothetical protein